MEDYAHAWQGLLDSFAGVPNERLAEPGVAGDWSAKDVLTHVAYWDNEDVAAIERTLKGVPDPEGVDYEAVNVRVAIERRDWTVARVRDDLLDTHARVVSALRAAPDFSPETVRESLKHYDDHAAEIRAWRERVGL